MQFLKKPLVAIVLTVLLVVGSTFLSADRKLSRSALRVVDGFYDGIRYNRQTHDSVAQCLRTLGADAEPLVIIGDTYGLDTAPLSSDAAALRQIVSSESRNISGVHAVFEPFYNKRLILVNDLEHTDLSDRHSEQLKACAQEIADCRAKIDASGYNESVTTFLRRNSSFPTRQFANLFGIDYPSYFA